MVDDARLQDLFTPLTIGSLNLRNRFAMAPMTRAASPGGVPGADVAASIEERRQAKLAKDYPRADAIRQSLLDRGVILEDSRDGTRWRRGSD